MTGVITWRPGIGDPTFVGWMIFSLYAISGSFSIRAGIYEIKQRNRGQPQCWFFVAGFLLLLAINKQLDLQTLFLQVGRRLAEREGWYADRRKVQLAFVLLLAAAMCYGLLRVSTMADRFFKNHRLVSVGLISLVIYILLRAALFDHVDAALGLNVGDAAWMQIFELFGVFCCLIAASRCVPKTPKMPDS
jgi:hypothetical protein